MINQIIEKQNYLYTHSSRQNKVTTLNNKNSEGDNKRCSTETVSSQYSGMVGCRCSQAGSPP